LAIVIGLPYGIEGVAWAIVSSAAFIGLYQYWLAVKCLKANPSGYPLALIPAVVLNSLLAAVLFVTDHMLPQSLRSNDYTYLALMGLAGGAIYLVGFLYLPFSTLQTEQQRWKTKLRLTTEPVA
ncbi:MAG: lipopolysaccharide biosynthesis protein, partial [Thiobacillus sp.]|nr:lipopolysaccharide biosynthesis protein [Thiobacillus sp.]